MGSQSRCIVVTAVVVALLAAVVAGCGAGEQTESEGPQAELTRSASGEGATSEDAQLTSSRGQFVAAGNRICADMNLRADQLPVNAGDAKARKTAAILEAGLAELAALEAPREDRAALKSMISHFRRMVRGLRLLVRTDDESVLPIGVAILVEGERGSRIAKRLGLEKCVIVPAPSQPKPDAQPIREAAQALVPPQAKALKVDAFDCVDGAPSPSCASVALDFGGLELQARMDQVEATATGAGWRRTYRAVDDVGFGYLLFNRNDYEVEARLLPDSSLPGCEDQLLQGDCVDRISIKRVRAPNLP